MKKLHKFFIRCLGCQFPAYTRFKMDEKYVKKEIDIFKKHLSFLTEYVCIAHVPQIGHMFENGHRYASFVTNNYLDEKQHVFLVLNDVKQVKKIAQDALENGFTIPFTSDIRYFRNNEYSLLDTESFDYETLLGMNYIREFDKTDCIQQRILAPNHAMLLVGVEQDEETGERAWKVLNSWGKKDGRLKGFLIMSEEWFDKFVFEITVPVRFLSSINFEKTDPKPLDITSIFSTVA